MLCVTGSVACFWGDVCAQQVCLEGNCFTVCEDLHAILCAVRRQVIVVHRLCHILSLEGSTALEDRTLAGSLNGRPLTEGRPSWKTGQDFEGWQEFAGGWVFCWRTASMEDRTLLEDAVSCTSLCVRMMELCVHVLCVA